MRKEIDEMKQIYFIYTRILSRLELLTDSEYRTIKYNFKLKRLRNRTLKDMDILYKAIKEFGGING